MTKYGDLYLTVMTWDTFSGKIRWFLKEFKHTKCIVYCLSSHESLIVLQGFTSRKLWSLDHSFWKWLQLMKKYTRNLCYSGFFSKSTIYFLIEHYSIYPLKVDNLWRYWYSLNLTALTMKTLIREGDIQLKQHKLVEKGALHKLYQIKFWPISECYLKETSIKDHP